jgi:hypothetical protein
LRPEACNGRIMAILLRSILLLSILAGPALARVVRIEIQKKADVLDGRSFGLADSYEALTGKAHFAVHPSNSANRIIADIDNAPVNQDGEVEFSAEFYILRPKDMARANGAVLCDIPNRGNKTMLSMFNLARGSNSPESEEHFGDGFLMRSGYTLLFMGWQFDPPHGNGRLRVYPPTASINGKPIRGVVRADFVVTDRVRHHILSDRDHIPYEVADPEAKENVLTVRDSITAPRHTIPRSKWKFAQVKAGEPVADNAYVYLEDGFEPDKIYEVVYVSQDPPLAGMGPTGVRDMVAYLKHSTSEELGIPGGSIDRAHGFGISQCGRFLRTFLYYGFNEDEQHRKVFDGVMSHVAGGGRGSFNHRFAQPSRDAHPYMNFFHPTDIFPFSDEQQKDPETGITDGLLTHKLKPEFWPKIFYTNSAYEYWGRAASLIHTTLDGKRDVEPLDNTRAYLFSSTQHGPAGFPPKISIGQQRDNPMNFKWAMRGLLSALDRWVADGTTPPPSQFPRVDDGSAVSAENMKFPKIPGVSYSSLVHKAYRADYGPEFRTKGIVSQEPPKIGSAFGMLVPAIDADGNDRAGIRLPELEVPLATYTGWNVFNAKSGPTREISSMKGSYIPFARTAAERKANGDPRLSIEERYRNREHYLGLTANAALKLVDEGYLLGEDVPEILRKAREHWDYLVEPREAPSDSR